MTDYKVQLEVFEGPLDLLLYLIKKEEVDIYNIPIARITSQYMEYLSLLKMIVPDVAGEFVVMGATLMYIKSRMLLPEDQQVSDPDAVPEDNDPRWDLIRQLVEYKKFKEAAEHLQQRAQIQENLYARQQATLGFDTPAEDGTSLSDVSIFDLLNAFNQVLKRADQPDDLRVITVDAYTVSDKIDFILKVTAMEEKTCFSRLFEGMASRAEIIVTFLALLELIRLKQLQVEQSSAFGEIDIVRAKPDLSSPAAEPQADESAPPPTNASS
ncbi:MAG: segregation/condensation protein A [Verrucomicrobia bacterium]|nr:segregation/condensation protein A [Verrucomicrobiota bacterium]